MDRTWLEWLQRTSGRLSAWVGALNIQLLTSIYEAMRARVDGVDRITKKQGEAVKGLSYQLGVAWGQASSQAFGMMSRNVTTAIARMAGSQGGLGQTGLVIGDVVGGAFGKQLGLQIGGPAGARLGVTLGRGVGYGVINVLQTGEAIRVAGAKFAPMLAGGIGAQNADYFRQGAGLVSQVAGIQMATGAQEQEVFRYGQALAQLGLPFADSGAKAATMALATEKVLALRPNEVMGLLETAIASQGSSWKSVGGIIENVANASEQWRRVASSTGNPIAASLAASQTQMTMFKGVAERAKGTSLDLESLSSVTIGLANTMARMNLRPGAINSMIGDVTRLLAPPTGSFVEMYTHSYFLTDLLQRTGPGRQQMQELQMRSKELGLDPMNIALPLIELQSQSGNYTEQTFRNMVRGAGALRDTMSAGSTAANNLLAAQKLSTQFKLPPMFGRAMIQLHDEYQAAIEKGHSEDEAWQLATRAGNVQNTVNAIQPGLTIDNLMQMASNMSMAGLSTEQKLSLMAQTWVGFAGDYWANLRSEGKVLYDMGAKHVAGGQQPMASVSPDIMASAAAAAQQSSGGPPPGLHVVMPEVASKWLQRQKDASAGTPAGPGGKSGFKLGDTVASTARGVEQTSVIVYQGYIEQYAAETGVDPTFLKKQTEVESHYNPNAVSPAGAVGLGQIMPKTWKDLAPRIQERFPGEKISPTNPQHSLYGQALYMQDMLRQSRGDYQTAASKYNAGPNSKNLNNPETREYRKKIFGPAARERLG